MVLTGSVERGLVGLSNNEWAVEACPNLQWEIPVYTVYLLTLEQFWISENTVEWSEWS